MQTVILLAGGLGSGAWPYCGLRQKVTLPVAQVPMVRRLALQWNAAGIKEIVVVTGHGAGAVHACTADIPGVRFVSQTEPRGCGDATLAGLASATTPRAIVCCADIVTTQAAINQFLKAAQEDNAEAVVLGASHRAGIPVWDSLEPDGKGGVCGVWNKGNTQHPRFGGIACVKVEQLRGVLEASPGYVDNIGVGAMPPADNSLAAALNRLCGMGVRMQCAFTEAPLVDVNRPWDLVEANHVANTALFAEQSGIVLGDGAHIDDGAEIADGVTLILGTNASIGRGVIVKGNVILGDGAQAVHGAILGPNVNIGARSTIRDYAFLLENTVVGKHNVVGHCAEFYGLSFEHSLLWHYCCVSAIVGAHVDIGAATCCGTWRFDDGVREQKIGGHTERAPYHGGMSFIGDRSRTGVNAVLNPGVRVGSHSCIGPGVILYDDVPDGQLVLAQQTHTVKPWGSDRYAW